MRLPYGAAGRRYREIDPLLNLALVSLFWGACLAFFSYGGGGRVA